MPSIPPTRRKPSEDGYMLISVMILLAVFLVALTVGVPKVAESIQRDRELETMQRGKQYIRAIQLYYKKFHAYPPNMDALVKTNEIRFLRKKYIDPMTGKDDWKPIMYCQNKTPMAMGFFGQPLAGSGCGALAGIGPGATSPLNGSNGSNGTTSGLFSNTGSGGSSGATTGTGSDAGSGAGATDANGTPINNTGSPLSGQTFGGAGIVGVKPASSKQSILVYKKKNHYDEWEFLYDPLSDQRMITGGSTPVGQQPGAPGLTQPPTPIGTPPTNNNPLSAPPLPPETTAPPQ